MGRLILVAGPDGTTNAALARALVARGATPPRDGLPPVLEMLHDALRTELGRPGADTQDDTRHEKALLRTLLTAFADLDDAVVHDAELGALLPLYARMAARMGIGLRVLLALGNPLDDVLALRDAAGSTAPEAALLWTRRALEAERRSRGLPRRIVLLDDLLADPVAELDRAEAALALDRPPLRRGPEGALRAAVTELAARRAPDPEEAFAAPDLPDLAKAALEALRALAAGADPARMEPALDGLRARLDAETGAGGLTPPAPPRDAGSPRGP